MLHIIELPLRRCRVVDQPLLNTFSKKRGNYIDGVFSLNIVMNIVMNIAFYTIYTIVGSIVLLEFTVGGRVGKGKRKCMILPTNSIR